MRNFFTWCVSIFFQQGADDNHRCVICCCYWPILLRLSWMLTRPSRKQDAHCDTMLWSTTLSPQTSWILVGFFPCKVSISMYDGWSLREIWLQSASSISRVPFCRTDHVAYIYAHSILYWSLSHNCRENQSNCIILLATQAQCAELLKWPTYIQAGHRWQCGTCALFVGYLRLRTCTHNM